MITVLAMLSLTAPGHGADVVLHQSDTSEVARARVVLAGADGKNLEVISLEQLQTGPPAQLKGLGNLHGCTGAPVSEEDIEKMTEDANSQLAYLEFEAANATLDKAFSALACLAAPIDGKLPARIAYLQGVVAVSDGDRTQAYDAFARAVVFDPALAWDDLYPPDGKDLLALAKKEITVKEAISVPVVPRIGGGMPEAVLDGTRLAEATDTLALVSGIHLLQVGTQPAVSHLIQIEVESTPSLFLPAAVPTHALEWAATEEDRPRLDAVLGARFEDGTTAWVTQHQGLWRTTIGSGSWEELAAMQAPVVAGAKKSRKPKKNKDRTAQPAGAMAYTSAGLTTAASAVTIVFVLKALSASKAAKANQDTYDTAIANGDWQAAPDHFIAGHAAAKRSANAWVGAGAGAALTAAGVVITVPLFNKPSQTGGQK